jgi:hypothetical protein
VALEWKGKVPQHLHDLHYSKLMGRSLSKPRRSTHIHDCRHKELARLLERLPSELRYCFTCFIWFTEEKWDEHCQSHLSSIISKRCATITYCNTLFRPAFCPFCLGDETLLVSKRWTSFAKDANHRSHLEQYHLGTCHWPSNCPHPLCNLQLDDETAFLHHLSDMHGLRATRKLRVRSQEHNPKDFVPHDPKAAGQKRKRQDDELLDQTSPDRIRTVSPLALLKDSSTGDRQWDLPRSAFGEPASIPDVDWSRLDQFEQLEDPSENIPDECDPPPHAQDELFSLFLRSRSPSLFAANSLGDDNDGCTHSQSASFSDTRLSVVGPSCKADSPEHHIASPKAAPKSQKPRITLQVPESRGKPKISLRLRQPTSRSKVRSSTHRR